MWWCSQVLEYFIKSAFWKFSQYCKNICWFLNLSIESSSCAVCCSRMIPVLTTRLPVWPVSCQMGFGALSKIYFGQFSGFPIVCPQKLHTLHCDRTLVYVQTVKCCITVEIIVTLLVLVNFCVDFTFYSYKPNCFSSESLTDMFN